MKIAKKLLVLLLVILLVNSITISSFASVTPAVTEANKGEVVTVAFAYDNIAGIRGTFSVSGDDILNKVELEASGSGFSGTYNDKQRIIAYYAAAPARFVCTLKLTISDTAAVGDEVQIKFEYESTVDGRLPSVPSYSYDYATIRIVLNLDELNKQIGIAQGLNKDDYTAESWAVLADALDDAIKAKNATTQAEVDAAAKALKAAIAGLAKKPGVVVDYTELNKQIENAQKLNEEDYTAESWAVLADALEDAIKAKNATTQAEVDAAVKALTNAIAGLEKKPAAAVINYSELNKQIEIAQKLNEKDYTAKSWKVLADALKNAIQAKNATTQAEVDAAAKALKDAIAGLAKKPGVVVDYTELNKQIEIAQKLNEEDYTAESWAVLVQALNDAIDARKSQAQPAIDAAAKTLKAAIAGLEKRSVAGTVDYSKLKEQIDRAAGLDKDAYTEESWKRVQAALDTANKLMNTGSQPEVDAATLELRTAIDSLELKSGDQSNTACLLVILFIIILIVLAILLIILYKKRKKKEQ